MITYSMDDGQCVNLSGGLDGAACIEDGCGHKSTVLNKGAALMIVRIMAPAGESEARRPRIATASPALELVQRPSKG